MFALTSTIIMSPQFTLENVP